MFHSPAGTRQLFIVLAILILLSPYGFLQAQEQKPASRLQPAADYFSRGDYQRAVKAYRQAVRIAPDADGYAGLGRSFLRLGANEAMVNVEVMQQAVEAFQAGLRIDPGRSDIRRDLGLALLELGDREGALREQRVLEKEAPSLAAELAPAIARFKPAPAYRELGSREEGELATRVEIEHNAVLVPVTLALGGVETRAVLLLDTGASLTTITPDVAARLGIRLDQAPQGKVQVVGGGVIDARAVRVDRIAVGPRAKGGMTIAVIRHNGPAVRFDGLLGMDFLRDFRYHVDFRRKFINWAP